MELHWEILDRSRRRFLPLLKSWKDAGYYLAGGTSLALQIGHRTSIDFDYYSPKEFRPEQAASLLKIPPKKLKITVQSPGTLMAISGSIQISVFHYPYRLLDPLIETPYLSLASIRDIAAMKLLAVAQRGKKRDFIDLYFICRRYRLRNIFAWMRKKYPMFDVYAGLRGLVYFEDAEKEHPRRGVAMRKPASWGTIKNFFLDEARFLEREWR